MTRMPPPIDVVKNILKAGWEMGDFGAFSPYNTAGDEKVAKQVQVRPGERILDAACGAGVFSLYAAQAGAVVTGIDIAANLIGQARARARGAGLQIQFDEGDVEALPYPDASFDTVVSEFGMMFAPRPSVATAEIARVLAPVGRVVLFNWTPTSWVSQLNRAIFRYAHPPPNAPNPTDWGDEITVNERLSASFEDIRTHRDTYRMASPFGPNSALEFILHNMGPVRQAYTALQGTESQPALRADLENFFQETNQGQPDSFQTSSKYLQVEARKR